MLNWLRRHLIHLQRRWIADPVERDRHAAIVRERLPVRRLSETDAADAPDDTAADIGPSFRA